MEKFCYSLEGWYVALSSSGDHATIPSEHDILTCLFTQGHICQFDTVLYPTERV